MRKLEILFLIGFFVLPFLFLLWFFMGDSNNQNNINQVAESEPNNQDNMTQNINNNSSDNNEGTLPFADLEFQETNSGLKYSVIKEGDGGEKPKVSNTVKVHYEGKLENGEIFDSSFERGEPIEFPLGSLILGWQEGITLMSRGAEYAFIIPATLGYGDGGVPGAIPGGATLYFRVQLLDF